MKTEMQIDGGNLVPVISEKPWGRGTTFCVTQQFAVQELRLKAHTSLSRQLHLFKHEMYLVLEGTGRLELGYGGDVVHLLSPRDAVTLPARTVHRLVSNESELVILEVSTPEVTDIVRLHDSHGRSTNSRFDTQRYWAALAVDREEPRLE